MCLIRLDQKSTRYHRSWKFKEEISLWRIVRINSRSTFSRSTDGIIIYSRTAHPLSLYYFEHKLKLTIKALFNMLSNQINSEWKLHHGIYYDACAHWQLVNCSVNYENWENMVIGTLKECVQLIQWSDSVVLSRTSNVLWRMLFRVPKQYYLLAPTLETGEQ